MPWEILKTNFLKSNDFKKYKKRIWLPFLIQADLLDIIDIKNYTSFVSVILL